jgi:hypothetical protein
VSVTASMTPAPTVSPTPTATSVRQHAL